MISQSQLIFYLSGHATKNGPKSKVGHARHGVCRITAARLKGSRATTQASDDLHTIDAANNFAIKRITAKRIIRHDCHASRRHGKTWTANYFAAETQHGAVLFTHMSWLEAVARRYDTLATNVFRHILSQVVVTELADHGVRAEKPTAAPEWITAGSIF